MTIVVIDVMQLLIREKKEHSPPNLAKIYDQTLLLSMKQSLVLVSMNTLNGVRVG